MHPKRGIAKCLAFYMIFNQFLPFFLVDKLSTTDVYDIIYVGNNCGRYVTDTLKTTLMTPKMNFEGGQ